MKSSGISCSTSRELSKSDEIPVWMFHRSRLLFDILRFWWILWKTHTSSTNFHPSRTSNPSKCSPQRHRFWAKQSPWTQRRTSDKHSDLSATELGEFIAAGSLDGLFITLTILTLCLGQIDRRLGRRESETGLQRREGTRRHPMEEEWSSEQENFERFGTDCTRAGQAVASAEWVD